MIVECTFKYGFIWLRISGSLCGNWKWLSDKLGFLFLFNFCTPQLKIIKNTFLLGRDSFTSGSFFTLKFQEQTNLLFFYCENNVIFFLLTFFLDNSSRIHLVTWRNRYPYFLLRIIYNLMNSKLISFYCMDHSLVVQLVMASIIRS